MTKRNGKLIASLLAGFAIVAAFAQGASAQRARSVSNRNEGVSTGSVPPAPPTIKAKYEGGMFGYNQKLEGALTFDDRNNRFVFRDKNNREIMSLPYESINAAYADNQSRRPTAATMASGAAPYGLGLPALLIKKKYRYLTIQYRDPDTQASGIVSYKIDDKNLLASELTTLAQKTGMQQRGDGEVFVRKNTPTDTTPNPNTPPQSKPTPQP